MHRYPKVWVVERPNNDVASCHIWLVGCVDLIEVCLCFTDNILDKQWCKIDNADELFSFHHATCAVVKHFIWKTRMDPSSNPCQGIFFLSGLSLPTGCLSGLGPLNNAYMLPSAQAYVGG